jgi:integrase
MPRQPKQQTHMIGKVQVRKKTGRRYWAVRYSLPGGQRKEISLEVTNLKRALEKAREIDEMLQRGDYAGLQERDSKKHTTMEEFIEEFKQSYTGWSEDTFRRNRYFLENIIHEWGEVPLRAIGAGAIQRWLGRLQKKGSQQGRKRREDEIRKDYNVQSKTMNRPLSKATINRHRSCLSALFKTAVQWGYVAHNPVRDVPHLKEEQTVPESLTDEDIAKLMAELKPYAQIAVFLLINTGCRQEELFGMKWDQVNFERNLLMLPDTKTGDFRAIPMIRQIRELLLQRQQNTESEYVITGEDGEHIQSIKKSLKRAAERAGIPHVHHHKLRHTFATKMRELGVPLDRIQELLGHKTMAMTMRYAKATPTQLEGAMKTLEEATPEPSLDTSVQTDLDLSKGTEQPSQS